MADLKKIAEDFSLHMCAKFGASIHQKETAFEMKAIAWGMDLGSKFGMTGLASSEEFLTRYTTTIGTAIYMPASHRNDPRTLITVLTHECQHVAQFKESGVEFGWLYLAEGEARVKYEADAYAAGLAIGSWMSGEVPEGAVAGTVDSLVRGYHLRPEDATLAEDIMKSHIASLKNGVVMARSAREAISWFNQNYSSLRGKL